MNCQDSLQKQLPKMREAILETTNGWREHAFAFSENKSSETVLGDCDEVEKPYIENEVGTFHTHTIDYSKPSPDDIELFKQSKDKLFCYARPMEDIWNIRCYNKDEAVCAEAEIIDIPVMR
jgi:hypothetical protein